MKYLILFAILLMGISVNAQQPYKYVLIPTHFDDFGNDLNPYGLSSVVQAELDKQSIKGVFATNQMPEDYCETLTVNLVKTSSLLRNKVKVELKDCMSKVIWSNEGTGRSKDYREGFGEAVVDALKNLAELPVNTTISGLPQKVETAPKVAALAKTEKEPAVTQVQPEREVDENYKPVNPYYNGTYLVDVVDAGNSRKELLILNGEVLGYTKQQRIATLAPSGLEDVFTISWVNPDGESVNGVAKLTAAKLEISLSKDGQEEVIVLQKL